MQSIEWVGGTYLGNGRCRFRVWAPLAEKIEVHILSPQERFISLSPAASGYYEGVIEDVAPGVTYLYRINGDKERPDPASRFQPDGVHGPSQVVDPSFDWNDASWHGLLLEDYVIYEVHVGVFTQEGTFDAIVPCLEDLKALGITAIELMPIAQFPGTRNWGYDGVYPFAVQDSYGGPAALKRLVDACHKQSMAVILDVVYNHPGPEGNYLQDFAPYFTDRYRTPWGPAVNFDGTYSDEVREFFVQNALYWLMDFHIDSLRLDALHAIVDMSARPFLEELAASVHDEARKLNRTAYLIAESNRNDVRLIKAPELGGFGLDSLWNDDFHHAVHVLLTGEQAGYYQDFDGFRALAKSLTSGFVYTGEYSKYRKRHHGGVSHDLPTSKFVAFSQNHDQVGNRMLGERLSRLVSFDKLKLAAGAVLLSPFIPLLFMGEEYGETAPFLYFTSHSNRQLIDAVRQGRRQEFAAFAWQGEPPDPQSEATFLHSKLERQVHVDGHHRVLYQFYGELLRLRTMMPTAAQPIKAAIEVTAIESMKVLALRRRQGTPMIVIFNFSDSLVSLSLPMPRGRWFKKLDSAEVRWLGPGSPLPPEFRSKGEVRLSLSQQSFAAYQEDST